MASRQGKGTWNISPAAFSEDLRGHLRRRRHGRALAGRGSPLALAADPPAEGRADHPDVLRACASGAAAASPTSATASSGSSRATRSIRRAAAACARAAPARSARTTTRTACRSRSSAAASAARSEWTAVTWDEAFTYIAERMQKIKAAHGPESIAMFNHGIGVRFIQHVLKSYGCTNFAGPSFAQCRGPRDVGFSLTFGSRPRLAGADRHREHRLPGADRLAPRREHAQHAGAGVRQRDRAAHPDHRRRPALLGRGEQGEVLAADQARHRHRAAARVDERAGDRGPLRPGVRREVRPRLRQVRRRDQAVHAGVGGAGDRHRRGHDPHDGARVRRAPTRVDRPPRTAGELVRRRHAAQPRDRAAERAARQLGPQGRAVSLRRASSSRPIRCRSIRSRTSRSPTTRTASATRSPTRRSPPASARRR